MRALAESNGLYLMVRSPERDTFEFPGGGVEEGEDLEQAVVREVKEETGYEVVSVGACLIKQFERYPDFFEEGSLFEMTNHFFECEVAPQRGEPELSINEQRDGIAPVWISLDRALEHNQRYAQAKGDKVEPWILRAIAVMTHLKSSRG